MTSGRHSLSRTAALGTKHNVLSAKNVALHNDIMTAGFFRARDWHNAFLRSC